MSEQRVSKRRLKPNLKYSDSALWQTQKRRATKVIKSTEIPQQEPPLTVTAETTETPPKDLPPKDLPLLPQSSPEPEEDSSEDEVDYTNIPLSEDQQIKIVKKLYRDTSFSGAYSGILTMQKCLLKEKGLKVSQRIISKALYEFPSYVMVRANYVVAIKSLSTTT